jgi:hypothetical protein
MFYGPQGLPANGRQDSAHRFNPEPNGTKLRSVGDAFAPEGLQDCSPGFQPWEISDQAFRPETAREHVVRMGSQCYRNGIGYPELYTQFQEKQLQPVSGLKYSMSAPCLELCTKLRLLAQR